MNKACYRKILVPIDGSKNSFKAAEHAGYLASCLNAEIGLLYVLVLYKDIPVYTQISSSYIPPNFYTEAKEFGQQALDEAAKIIPSSIPVSTFLEVGSPVEIIPQFCKQQGYDLIIIGSRGLGLIKGLVMGSVSSYVVHHATCPVMVIK